MGLLVAICGMSICLLFRLSLHYFYTLDQVNDKIYDLNLVTASDYTVDCVIKPTIYQNFLKTLNGRTENATQEF